MSIKFRLAQNDDSESLLSMINTAYAVSEAFLWKPNTVRTYLKDVQDITSKTFNQQDIYIIAIDNDNQIVGCIRYEPKFQLKNKETNTTINVLGQHIFPLEPDPNTIYTMLSESEVYNPFTPPELDMDNFAPILSQINALSGEWEICCIGHFSQFVISNNVQSKGYGAKLLNHIESLTLNLPHIIKSLIITHSDLNPSISFTLHSVMEMIVLSPRQDMIKFYEKRGYATTGTLPPEPYMLGDVLPHYIDLVELKYEKDLTLEEAFEKENGDDANDERDTPIIAVEQ